MATVDSDPLPPASKRLPRTVFVIAGVALFVTIVAAAAPWAFSNAALRAEIAMQIRRKTGLATIAQGHAVFVVLPQPHVSIDDVSFADPSGGLRVDAHYLKGYVRLISLLTGRIEISSATLGQPDVYINLDGVSAASDGVIARAADVSAGGLDGSAGNDESLGSLTLADGHAHLASKEFRETLAIDAINVTLDWRKRGAAAFLTGQAQIDGETAAITAWLASPAALLRGQQSPMSLRIGAPSLALSVDGGVASAPEWKFSGHIHGATPSARALSEKVGHGIPFPGPFNDFDAECNATISAQSALLSELNLRFDGNEFEGALAFEPRDALPVLSGTLATNRLSLQSVLSGLPSAAGRDGQWNRDPLDLGGFGPFDLDLRLSAAHMLFSHYEIEDAAFSVMRNGGRLELSLAGAKAYQGDIKGRVTFDSDSRRTTMKAAGAIEGADFAALSFGAFGWPEFAGTLNGTASLESTGTSVSELMRNLGGMAQVNVTQGQLGGIDLESALHRIDKTPLALLADIHRGQTAFDHATFSLRIANGVARIEESNLESSNLRLGLGGTVDFGERGLDLHAVAKSIAVGASDKEVPDFKFDIIGSWDNPAFTPDVRSLIRRSGAAAPLFSQQRDGGRFSAPDPENGP